MSKNPLPALYLLSHGELLTQDSGLISCRIVFLMGSVSSKSGFHRRRLWLGLGVLTSRELPKR